MLNQDIRFADWYRVNELMRDVTARALSDQTFKAALISDPVRVLEESGIYFSKGRSVVVVQNTPDVYHFVLPNIDPPSASGDMHGAFGMENESGGNGSLDGGGPRCTKP